MSQTIQSFPCYAEIYRCAGPVIAAVLGAETGNGLALIRGLGRMGIPVAALGQEQDSISFYSRYVSDRLVYRDPHHAPDEFASELIKFGKKLKNEGKRAVLFPTSDRVVEAISRNEKVLSEYFILNFPAPDVLAKCLDKQAQYRLAGELGVPFPKTYTESEIEELRADLASGAVEFPILLKSRQALPLTLRRKFRVAVLENKAELDATLAAIAEAKVSFIIQEIIPGDDDTLYTLGSYMNRASEFKGIFTGRKLRQQPPRFGICRVGESKHVEEIIRHGEKLLRGLNFFGISQVEFKYDHRNGQYKLIEVNPRSWSWIGLPIRMGVNLPYAFFCDALGIDIPCQKMPDKRGLFISLYDDLYWSLKSKDGKPWSHLFQGYEFVVEPYYAADDRKPGLMHFKKCSSLLAKSAIQKVTRALRPTKSESQTT